MLTARAEQFIKGLKRNDEWTCDRETAIKFMESKGIPAFEPVVKFQTDYSGLYEFELFSKDMIAGKEELYNCWYEGNECELLIGGSGGPFDYGINQKGEIISLQDGTVLYSSIEILFEQYVLEKELFKMPGYCSSAYNTVPDIEKAKTFLQNDNFHIMNDCSDEYSMWFTRGNITIHCGMFAEGDSYFLKIYTCSKEICEEYVCRLENEKVID